MNLALAGHSLEAIGAIAIAVPVISILVAQQRIILIDRAAKIPAEIRHIINKANRESAVWPNRIELSVMVLGFVANFIGLMLLIAHELINTAGSG